MKHTFRAVFVTTAFFLMAVQASAQQPWRANLSFNPRPTPYIDQWQSNGSIGTLQVFNPQNSPVQVVIGFQVSNLSTNKIVLRGRTSPQSINAYPSPTIMNNTNFIGSVGLQYDESQKVTMIRTGMLPEGEYSICLTFMSMSNQILLQDVCSNFSVVFSDPPKLINPENRASLTQTPTLFNWTPVQPSGGNSNYEIKIVEVLGAQSPTDALRANPPLTDQANLNSPTFLLSPDVGNTMKAGATYAWRVRVLDANKKPFTRADGYTEIYLFSVKAAAATPKPSKLNTVIGIMKYGFADPTGAEGLSLYPLKNIGVNLVLRHYHIKGTKKEFFGDDSLLASAKTDGLGHFSFSTEYSDPAERATGGKHTTFGDSYRQAFVLIDDIHYSSPENTFALGDGKTVDAGEIHGYVKSFGLKVTVKDVKPPYIVSGATVYLYRVTKGTHTPDEEGTPRPNPPESFFDMPCIGKAIADKNGSVSFGRMVNCYYDENYMVLVAPPDYLSGYQYPITMYPLPPQAGSIIFTPLFSPPVMNSDISWQEYQIDVAPEKITSGVKGMIRRGFDGSSADNTPLANTDVHLQIRYKNLTVIPSDFSNDAYPDNGKVIAYGKTDASGKFSFQFTDVPKTSDYSGVTRMYRIIVDDKHFTSPDDDVTLFPGEVKDMGTVKANIRTYNLKVSTLKTKSNAPLPGMYVYVRRPARPESVPADEGSPHPDPPIQRSGEDVVAVGLTSGSDASIVLTRLVRCYSDYERYHFETVSDPTTGTNYLGFTWDDFSDKSDDAEFNSQYLTPTIEKKISVFPLPAAITGRVIREDNKMSPIADALVTMIVTVPGDPDWHPSGAVTTTDKDGYYFIDGKQANGSGRRLQATKHGYQDSPTADLPQYINDGEQSYHELTMMPNGIVKGKIFHAWAKPSDGNTGYRAAWVTVEHGTSVYTASDFSLPTNLDEPSDVIVQPDDQSYFADTLSAYKPHGIEEDLGNIYVMKKLHRIRVVTLDEETGKPVTYNDVITEMANPQFPGAVIPPDTHDADASFWAPFESSDKYFSFTTYTNTDADYEHRTYTINNPLSKDFLSYTIKTKKAGFISGTVYLYSKKTGKKDVIDYAKVRMEQASSDGEFQPFWTPTPGNLNPKPKDAFKLDELYAYSGYSLVHKTGVYKLGNIPVGKHTFMASKSKSGAIGEEKTLTVPKEGLQNVDFYLQVYEDMDITKMLGISMDVEKLDSLPSGVFITGSFSELPSSDHFKASSGTEVDFTNIRITPGAHMGSNGVPYPKPVSLPLVTDETSIPVSYMYSQNAGYNAQVKGANGKITMTSSPDEKGSISGKIYIPVNQFSPKVSFVSGNENGFYLAVPNKSVPDNMNLPVIASDGKDAFTLNSGGLQVVDKTGKSGSYTLMSFNASFDAANSLFRGDSVTLATTLNLPDISKPNKSIPLSIGNVRLRGTDVGISIPANTSLPEIALDNWKLQCTSISLGVGSLSMDGVLKTGSVDVPFTGMPISPQGWKPEQAAFKLTSLSIASIIPLSLNAAVNFGHDIAAMPPCWKLYSNQASSGHVAAFGNINGMPAGDSVYITSFSLTSLGSNSFILQKNIPIHLFTYLTFTPDGISLNSPGKVELSGGSNLAVTNGFYFSNRTLSLSSQGGVLTYDPKKLLYDIKDYYAYGTKSNYAAADMDLNATGFFAKGTLVDQAFPKAYSFPVIFQRTADSTAIVIQPQSQNGTAATFPISKDGSRSLTNIKGDMVFNSPNSWGNLNFSGSLTGTTGASGIMSMKVTGAIQTDGDQKIAVTNIPTPLGGATMTFDFASGAMHGAIDLNADLPGAGHIDGQADLEIDKSGWYFAANGDLHIVNPNIEIQAALVLGSYPNILSLTDITGKFDNLPWKQEVPAEMRKIPQAYNSLGGFYFAGDCTNFLGISLPSIDVDLDPIVHCSVSAYYGAAISLGMNFSVGTQFDIGAAAFVGVDADAGGSIGIACGGGSLHCGLNMYGTGAFNTSSGNWSVKGSSNLILSGELYAGWGVCSSSCGWFTCDKHTWGPAQMSFGLIGFHVGSDGFSIKP